MTPHFPPCVQPPLQRTQRGGRQAPVRGPQGEQGPHLPQVRRPSPLCLLSAPYDTPLSALFAASATTYSTRRPPSTCPRASSRTRPSSRSSMPPPARQPQTCPIWRLSAATDSAIRLALAVCCEMTLARTVQRPFWMSQIADRNLQRFVASRLTRLRQTSRKMASKLGMPCFSHLT